MTLIKLCGLRRQEDMIAANRCQPDYIGFVFASASRRYVTPTEAATLRQMLSPSIKAVGVFVDAPVEEMVSIARQVPLDVIQLHGKEDNQTIAKLREQLELPVIQAFQIKSASTLDEALQSTADDLLFDAGQGDGRVFDWQLLKDFPRPYFLAGGLGVDNIVQAMALLQPYGVDASSGLETDGLKDAAKMQLFTEMIRRT